MTRPTRPPWRTIAAALPAVALVGTGVAFATTGGYPATHIVANSTPLITVPSTPLPPMDAPPLPTLPAPSEQSPTTFGQSGQSSQSSSVPSVMTASGIPAVALAAYQRAARLVDAADAQCQIDWALIGAIGKVESNHGRYGGNGIASNGAVLPGIYGIPLNGTNNTAVIHDTDGGVLDHDPVWDRAVGPMQFIPGTWRSVGVDATGSGTKDPQNMYDAAAAAAVYLCSGPGQLNTDAGARNAVMRYNQSQAYVDEVMAIAAAYRGGYTVVPDSGLSAAQRNGTPYLPSGDPQTMQTYNPVLAAQPASKSGKTSASGGKQTSSGGVVAGAPGSSSGGSAGSSGGSGSGTGGGTSGGTSGVLGQITGLVPTPTTTSVPLPGGTPTPTPSSTPTPSPPPIPIPTPTLSGLPGVLTCPLPYLYSPITNKCHLP
ncbi:MAG TPA: lytic transglycosylase domain-containing protein [Pedococcus sp.]|nr:lytic transglycosylase domain-containing protein [Pedococcus sp.]